MHILRTNDSYFFFITIQTPISPPPRHTSHPRPPRSSPQRKSTPQTPRPPLHSLHPLPPCTAWHGRDIAGAARLRASIHREARARCAAPAMEDGTTPRRAASFGPTHGIHAARRESRGRSSTATGSRMRDGGAGRRPGAKAPSVHVCIDSILPDVHPTHRSM